MAWTASVTGSQKIDGRVEVTVEYTDGVSPFSEVYRNSNPTAEWIPNTVFSRIQQLDVMDAFTIGNGVVTPIDPNADPNPSEWEKKAHVLTQFAYTLVNQGDLPPNNPTFLALKSYVLNNANTYFQSL